MDEATGRKGENDQILEISSRVAIRGQVLKIKILRVIDLIDEGRAHCKVIAIGYQ
jgi:inorganic pyrophosphatase